MTHGSTIFFFIDRFGSKPEKGRKTAQRKPRNNKALQTLRQQKKECKAARKALLKAGLAGTAAEKLLTKEWLSLVRKHNKLHVEMKRRHQVREKISAERSFKQDPHKFASKLFEKQQRSGSPSFSAETAFKYFQETYTDVERDFIYTAPEGMQRPNPPNFIFSVRCPTHAEIYKSIRWKRNGSTPGLNALTYVPYKKCKALQKIIVKFTRKIWRKEIFLLTGHRHLLFCYLNLRIWL